MKIDPTAPQRTAGVRRDGPAGKTRNGNFAKALGDTGSTTSASHTVGLGSVNPMLSLQEVPDPVSGRARAKRRGEQLLDKLEMIRLGLLAGTIPRNQLDDVAQMVRTQRETVDDPRLTEILDEIELRAAVEVAKLSRPS